MIYCIIGKSGSGKTTAVRYIEENFGEVVKVLNEYTTRPKRPGESEGNPYHFCTEAEMDELVKSGKVLEKRAYETTHGKWWYFNTMRCDVHEKDYVVSTTPEAAEQFIRAYGKENVLLIYLEASPAVRLRRSLARLGETVDYQEILRRFLSDEDEFCDALPIWRHPHIWRIENNADGKDEWLKEIKTIFTYYKYMRGAKGKVYLQ